jgi:hypothetical protein
MKEFDYIVVGGGSAGCAVAGRLSEDPKLSVCLLEAGGSDDQMLIRVPFCTVVMLPTLINNWAFETVPQPGLNGRRGYQPRGKALGGSSSINAMVYMRGHPWDYDHWAALGNDGWSFRDVLPYFRKSEHNEDFDDELHGRGGPLNVARLRSMNPFQEIYLEAARQAGFKLINDFNGADQEGIGIHQVTQKDGERWTAARAYLTPHLASRSNLTVITGARARRMLFSGKRADGVEFRQGGGIHVFRARRELILAAGALQSPQLLMLSGIGAGAELQKFDIPVIHDLPGVGKNLQDHPDYVFNYRARSLDLLGVSPGGAMRPDQGNRQLPAPSHRHDCFERGRRWGLPAPLPGLAGAGFPAAFRHRPARQPCAQAALGARLFLPRLPAAAEERRHCQPGQYRSGGGPRHRPEVFRPSGRSRCHGRRLQADPEDHGCTGPGRHSQRRDIYRWNRVGRCHPRGAEESH